MTEEKDLVAWCCLYCGDGFGYKGKVADLARDLRKELRDAKSGGTAGLMSSYSLPEVFTNKGNVMKC